MVKEICSINLLSIFPKYYITSKSSTEEKQYNYTFLVPNSMDKPIIKLYLTTLFNIKIKSLKIMNLKSRDKNKRLKKSLLDLIKNYLKNK